MAYVFISYSHKDKSYARKLANELTRHDVNVWIDDRIDYGKQWPQAIQQSLEECEAVIVIMSTNAFNSNWVQSELVFAQSEKKVIFPLHLEGKLWVSLASTQHVDIVGGKLPPEEFYQTLKDSLQMTEADLPLAEEYAKRYFEDPMFVDLFINNVDREMYQKLYGYKREYITLIDGLYKDGLITYEKTGLPSLSPKGKKLISRYNKPS